MSSNVVSLSDRQAIATYAKTNTAHGDRIERAWNAYLGNFSPSLITRAGRVDDNVYVNFCRLIVDKGVAFLFGKSVEFALDKIEDEAGLEQESEKEKWLKDAWEYNKKDILLQKLARNGGVTGHAFMKIINDPALPYPRLVVLDSSKICVETEEEDCDDVWQYEIKWNTVDKATGKAKRRRQRIVKSETGNTWFIIDEESYSQNDFSYQTTTNNDGSVNPGDAVWTQIRPPELWPYPFAPIVDNQNMPASNQFWGMSDLEEDIIVINEAINRVLSNTNRMIRVHSWPRIWTRGLTGEQAKQIRIDSEGIIHIPGNNGELMTIQVSGDVANSIEFYTRLRESLHELARIPEVATGKVEGIGALSGAALQILYGSIIEKNDEKRLTYGYSIKEISRRMDAVRTGTLTTIPELNWPVVVPKDDLVEAQTMVQLQAAGVSIHTTLEEAGYDPEKEADQREIEAELAAQRMIETQQAMIGGASESDNSAPANEDDNNDE